MKKSVLILFFIILFGAWASLSFARTVTDQLGRKVVVADNPLRLVALAPSATEIVFALGRGDRLKGVTLFSDYPAKAKVLPRVGSYVHLDLEKIVALGPDLCIAIKEGNPKEVVLKLESFGVPVYTVDPKDFTTVMETILTLGVILNAEERAGELVNDMRRRISRVKTLVSKAETRPGVFFQIGVTPIVSAGDHTFINQLIEIAGGRNLAAGPTPYPRFSREQVLALSPEILIITSMSRASVFKDIKNRWSRWKEMPAAGNNRIFLVDSNLFDRPTPRLVDGLETLGELIHPDLFGKSK